MRIRPARPGDLDEIIALLRQLWPGKSIDTDSVAAVFRDGLASADTTYLCAEVDERVVGFCSLLFHSSLWQEGTMAYVEVLVVDEAHRSRGIGSEMMDAVTDLARSRGSKMIEIDSALHRDRAHALYERLGFERLGYAFLKELF